VPSKAYATHTTSFLPCKSKGAGTLRSRRPSRFLGEQTSRAGARGAHLESHASSAGGQASASEATEKDGPGLLRSDVMYGPGLDAGI